IPGDVLVVEQLSSAKMTAKPIVGTFDLPAGDPRVDGATLQISDTGGGSPPMFASLPAAGWKGLGSPPGSGGYSYRGSGTAPDPCTSVIVKPAGIKFQCQGAGVTLNPPFTGN